MNWWKTGCAGGTGGCAGGCTGGTVGTAGGITGDGWSVGGPQSTISIYVTKCVARNNLILYLTIL